MTDQAAAVENARRHGQAADAAWRFRSKAAHSGRAILTEIGDIISAPLPFCGEAWEYCPMKFAAAVLIPLCLASAALAQAPAEPPAPTALTEAAVKAWVAQYIRANGWTYISADDAGVTLGGPDGVVVADKGFLQITIRHEYFQPRDVDGFLMRSNNQVWIIDCQNHRRKVTAMAFASGSNLSGSVKTIGSGRADQVDWIANAPDSEAARLEARACAAPKAGKPAG